MNISELIKMLEDVRDKHGDLKVFTDNYVGGDYELREPRMDVHGDFRIMDPLILALS